MEALLGETEPGTEDAGMPVATKAVSVLHDYIAALEAKLPPDPPKPPKGKPAKAKGESKLAKGKGAMKKAKAGPPRPTSAAS